MHLAAYHKINLKIMHLVVSKIGEVGGTIDDIQFEISLK